MEVEKWKPSIVHVKSEVACRFWCLSGKSLVILFKHQMQCDQVWYLIYFLVYNQLRCCVSKKTTTYKG